MSGTTKFLFLSVLTVFLCGCNFVTSVVDITSRPSSEERVAMADSLYTQTIDAISSKTESDLYTLFCRENQSRELAAEISTFLSHIDGNIVSKDEPSVYRRPIHFVTDSWEYALKKYTLKNIVTDSNHNYSLKIILCINADNNNRYKGLQSVSLYENETKLYSIGTIFEDYSLKDVPSEYKPIDPYKIFGTEIREDYMGNVLFYLKNNDKTGFLSLFSQEAYALAETNYDEIISFIDGPFITYSHTVVTGNEGGSYAYDHYESMNAYVTTYDIMTDEGTMYEISLDAYFINLTKPEEQGIHRFSIRRVDNILNDDFEHDVIQEIKF